MKFLIKAEENPSWHDYKWTLTFYEDMTGLVEEIDVEKRENDM